VELSIQHIRGTNAYRVDVWEHDYLHHTHFRLEDFGAAGWRVTGCPILQGRAFKDRNESTQALRKVMDKLGIEGAHTCRKL
jgi:hypothetical protein